MKPPLKHHYIPVFYLKRWAGTDGLVCQYSRPIPSKIAPVRRAPSATGFLDRAYELRGFAPELAQQVETSFFQPVDSEAADALSLLETHGNKATWSQNKRSAWTRFLLSLLMRCPEDVAMFRQLFQDIFYSSDPQVEAEYLARRQEGEPATYTEFAASMPISTVDQNLFEMYFDLIDNINVGGHINQLTWQVFDFPPHCQSLLTSDRPVIRTDGLKAPGSHIALPIGPKKLFVASSDLKLFVELRKQKPEILAREVNKLTVGSAVKFVYGVDDSQKRFVANRLGKTPQRRLVEILVESQQLRALNRSQIDKLAPLSAASIPRNALADDTGSWFSWSKAASNPN